MNQHNPALASELLKMKLKKITEYPIILGNVHTVLKESKVTREIIRVTAVR